MSEFSIEDARIDAELARLTELLSKEAGVQKFQQLEARVKNSERLAELEAEIKAQQQAAVQLDHYEKPIAAAQAIQESQQLRETFDTHPLVTAYREQLVETNDLVQHLTELLQTTINAEIDGQEGQEER